MEPKGAGTPAPALQRHRVLLLRGLLTVAIVAVAGYLFLAGRDHFLRPRLRIVGVINPAHPDPEIPVRVGLTVLNDRWASGSACAVLVIEDETSVRGPMTVVPARASAEVAVEARLDPGWYPATLELYAAAGDSVPLGSRADVPILVGTLAVTVETAAYAPTVPAGAPVPMTITVENRHGIADARLLPVAVLLSERAEELREAYGNSFTLPAGGRTRVRLAIETTELEPGPYYLALIMTAPGTGKRIGRGLYHQPLTVVPNEPPVPHRWR